MQVKIATSKIITRNIATKQWVLWQGCLALFVLLSVCPSFFHNGAADCSQNHARCPQIMPRTTCNMVHLG